MIAYVSSVAGICRVVRTVLPTSTVAAGRFAPWLAAAIFALNPNVIYLQATAMTEPVYLAFFIWAVVFFAKALRLCQAGDAARGNRALISVGLCLAAASLTRYDGWFLSAVMVVLA